MERKILKDNEVIIEKAKEILDDLFVRNPEFNERIDNITIPSKRNSEILFYTAIDSYLEELESWKENKTKEDYIDLLSNLGREGKNTLSELAQSIQRKRIAPFIGAGLCAPLQFPSWGQALKEIKSKLSDIDLTQVDNLIANNQYLEAAELLYNADKRTFTSYVSDRFLLSPNITRQDVFKGSLPYVPELASGCVITTNYDRVLEEIFKISNKPFDGFMHGIQNKNKFVTDLIKGDRCILKLHGSVGEEESYIFTQSQYNLTYGSPINFELPLPKTLRQIYISHSLLFLGCSLEQDRTLELFQTIKAEGHFEIPQHFAILPQPNHATKKREKENYLREINIKTLWYPTDEHDNVGKILNLAIDLANNKNSNILKS